MRLGGPLFMKTADPEEWIKILKERGDTAAFFPVGDEAPDSLIADYKKSAEENDILIAEVGAWGNPLSPNKSERDEAMLKCKRRLELAEKIGARCCVNISGSRSADNWAGPHADDMTDETFEMIVESVREIIDFVRPERTYYTLETMPWSYPDSADSYLRLIKAIDRERFAVHFDPVNIINSPEAYYKNHLIMKDFFKKLGSQIKSCHAKDISLSTKLTVHLAEVHPGMGNLCYKTYLSELNKLDPDTPLMLEHLQSKEQYEQAVEYIRGVNQ